MTRLAVLLAACALPFSGGAAEIARYVITDNRSIDAPLAGQTGDWQRGRTLYFDRKRAGCSGCHGSPGGPGAEIVAGNENAPRLARIADRMAPGEIRLWIAAPVVIAPGTEMPAYFLAGQRRDAEAPVPNGPRLTAGEIEDLVAYLSRQTGTP
ncbi:MAG: cytochrome c [Pseudomonadota bacterium]